MALLHNKVYPSSMSNDHKELEILNKNDLLLNINDPMFIHRSLMGGHSSHNALSTIPSTGFFLSVMSKLTMKLDRLNEPSNALNLNS